MKHLLIRNIARIVGTHDASIVQLRGSEMKHLPGIDHSWLLTEGDHIADFGREDDGLSTIARQAVESGTAETIDAEGGWLFPAFCDSHTHLVYSGSREGEFVDKIRGLSYAEIARRGGGILCSSDRLHEASEDELYHEAMKRVGEIAAKGTGAVEIKSGYGLNTDDELKMLRVIRRIRQTAPMRVVSTFLGAHAVGRAWQGRQGEYVDMIISEMLPEVARQQLADFVDVFCDEGFFTPDETRRILNAAARYGMRGKIHGQELADSGGVAVATQCGALSVDHLEQMTDVDIAMLSKAGPLAPIPTALPGTSFFLNMPFAPGRRIIDGGLPLAVASDYNPGSTPSGDMKFIVSLACIKMRLLPEEAINAATVNSAAAMGLSHRYGSIARGKAASFFITTALPSVGFLPYAYTTPLIRRVVLEGNMSHIAQ